MKRDDIILTVFFAVVVLLIAKTASLSYDPRTIGFLGILFFAIVISLALK